MRLRVVWLALVAVTLLSWWIGSSHGQGELASSALVTYGVLAIAAIKVRVIVREFMEVRHAPPLLRRLTDGWTLLVIAALLAIYSLQLSMPPV
jgi:cytochrome c oxidase subunit IV